MAKRIKIIPVLDTKTLFKQLKQLGNRKQKINVNVNGSGVNNTVQQLHQMNSAGNTSTSIFGKLKNIIKDTFSEGKIVTTAYLAVLNMVYKAGAKAKEAIEDIDESITNISVATNLSRKATADLVGEYNQYARELKATTKDVTDAADDWLRAGKTMEEAKELIKDSTMLSKLGQIAPTEATEDLLSTMNGYELSVEKTGEALDAMVAIDMRAATSAGDLATGLKYSASSAYSAGVSLNKLLGILGAVQDKTQQTSQVVGTFANTLLSRYRDITIGKYLTEDGEDISNYEATLKSIGISLRDSQGEFRSFETVLGEMANKWDTLSSVQQNALIKVAAGTRQQNRFIALMEGYNKVLELTEVAANSAGTAIEKYNNSYADSLEAKQNELQASFEALIMNNDFSKVYGDIIDATTALVDFINKTNALKGIATSFAVAGFIKGFLSISTGINEAYISLNQFHSALDLVQKKKLSTKEFDRLLLLTNKLSDSQTRMILSSKNLSIRQKEQILVAQGLSKEEAKLKLQTLGLTNAQTGLTASTTSLKNAAKGLLAYIAANPLTVLLTAISTASMVFSSYKNHLEELRQTAQDGANAYKESASSINDYVAKYQDLHRALLEAKGDEQATYDIKKQLLDLQNELNEKFGTEASKINLVSDAYRDQTEILKSYNKELANKYLNENREGIQTATKQMTKTREYTLSDNGISLDTASGKAVNDIVQKYSDKGMSLLESGAGTYQVVIKADAENAYEAINDFSNDLRERAKELGNEHLFDGILDISSKALNDAKSVVEDYSNIYKQALMAELVSDDAMSAVYNEALNAVEQYNQTLAGSTNPYSDENVANAKKNLDEVRAKIDGNLAEWGKYSSIINDLFEQADTKLIDFNNELTSNKELIADAMSLKNYSDLDLQAFNPGENEAFDRLKTSANEYGLSVEQLINALVRLGYVQGQISNTQSELGNSVENTKSKMIDLINSMSDGFDILDKIYADVIDGGSFDFTNLDSKKFTEAFSGLEDEYTAFIETVSGSPDDINACQKAFDDLVTAFINHKDILNNLTDENLKLTASMLENMGVVNAEEVVMSSLNSVFGDYEKAKREATNAGIDLLNATDAEINSLIQEKLVSEETAQGLFRYQFQKKLANDNGVNTIEDCVQLENLAKAAGYTGSALLYLVKIKGLLNDLDVKGYTTDSLGYKSIMSQVSNYNKLLQQLTVSEKDATIATVNYGGANETLAAKQKNAKDATKELKDELSDLDDAISTITKVIDKQIDTFKEQKEAAVDALETQKDAAEEALEAEKKLVQTQIDAKQKEIDKIKEAREERQNELELQKDIYDFNNKQNQRSKFIYKGGQMVYETDLAGIRDAREKVEETKENIKIASIEKEISSLEDTIDSLDKKIENSNDYYDKLIKRTETYWDGLIKGLEAYKKKWTDLAELDDQAEMIAKLQKLGITTDEILGMSESAFEGFKLGYMDLLNEMYAGNEEVLKSLSEFSNVDMSSVSSGITEAKKAIDGLNTADLSGISSGFDNVTKSVNNASNAIGGIGGNTSGNTSKSSNTNAQSGNSSTNSGVTSLKTAIEEQVKSAEENLAKEADLFNGEDGLTSAVDDVINKIGTEDSEDESTLISALQTQFDKTEELVPSQIEMFDMLAGSINNCVSGLREMLSLMSEVSTANISGSGIPVVTAHPYASGTHNAKRGIAEVAENGAEIITDGKIAVLAETPTLINMQGGETVYNADETEELLNSKGLKPLPEDSRLYKMIEAFQNKVDITPVSPFASKVEKNMENTMRNINNINTSNQTQNVSVGDVHVHSYGITKAEVAKEVGIELRNQFRGLSLNAYQRSNISR